MSIKPRTRVVLGCIAAFGCLAVPARYTSTAGLAVVSAFGFVQQPLARAGQQISLAFDSLASLRNSAGRISRLEAETDRLEEQLAAERAASAEKDRRLQALGEFVRHLDRSSSEQLFKREALIVGQGTGAQRGVLFIDRGSSHGIRKGMAVVVGQSIVGTVRAVSPRASSVLLVTSRGSAIDAELTSSGKRGVVLGNGDGTMRMKYVSQTAPRAGEEVVTHGRDGVIPRHFLMATVESVQREASLPTYRVILRPVRDLDQLVSVVAVGPNVPAEEFPAAAGENNNE